MQLVTKVHTHTNIAITNAYLPKKQVKSKSGPKSGRSEYTIFFFELNEQKRVYEALAGYNHLVSFFFGFCFGVTMRK